MEEAKRVTATLKVVATGEFIDNEASEDTVRFLVEQYLEDSGFDVEVELLKDQEAVVHPESSCEMTYITNCCCDLCGVQLIREDNFCRCCGKRIEWEGL